ncbi:MAG: hypothetical protein Hyperionvirus4_144 [Hyperionvirus sp.]|uniref:Uncharacterized protein n=1 Tax=Hyperionvirus sp. TaxID=2487770 RepID=A0A3G5ACV3_9VIRU|nr:MAG: hypothetical protein Hyperionvirus4_144 [Hyperionvirus sp.]
MSTSVIGHDGIKYETWDAYKETRDQLERDKFKKTKDKFFEHRKKLFVLFPDSDLWQANILFNSATKKFETYYWDDGNIWDCYESNIKEYDDLDSSIDYIISDRIENGMNDAQDSICDKIRDDYLKPYDENEEDDEGNLEEWEERFHCFAFGKQMINKLEAKLYCKFKKKSVDRTNQYPHYKPGYDIIFIYDSSVDNSDF